jgi:putative ABC transport system permease protein
VIVPYSIALAFGVALAVGVFFGFYPANRAASLRPIRLAVRMIPEEL